MKIEVRVINILFAVFFIVPLFFGQFDYAISKEVSGSFQNIKPKKSSKQKKPARIRKKPSTKQVRKNDPRYREGTYSLSATRYDVKGPGYCPSTYSFRIYLRDGVSTHRIPLGQTLTIRLSGKSLTITSTKRHTGGSWIGKINVVSKSGLKTKGILKWVGDPDRCAYSLAGTRL